MIHLTSAAPSVLAQPALPPTPRRVERRPGTRGVVWPVLLFVMPHTLIGAMLLLFTLLRASDWAQDVQSVQWQHVVAALGPALFWNGVMVAFWYQMLFRMLWLRHLVKHGGAVVGSVVKTEQEVVGHRVRIWVTYRYQLPSSSRMLEGRELVKPGEDVIFRGVPVVVVFHPKWPERSTLYDFAPYQVAQAPA